MLASTRRTSSFCYIVGRTNTRGHRFYGILYDGRQVEYHRREEYPGTASAFKAEYIDLFDVREHLIKKIHDTAKTFLAKRNQYISPYFEIVQSSGCGKSRIVKEVGQQMYTTYVSFAGIKSTSYPPRSVLSSIILERAYVESKGGIESMLRRFIYKTLYSLANTDVTAAIWFDHFSTKQTEQGKNMSVIKDIQGFMEQVRTVSDDDFKAVATLLEKKFGSAQTLLFAFDEARALVDDEMKYLRAFRRQLASVAQICGPHIMLCSVLIDTAPTVLQLAPPEVDDPSYRFEFMKRLFSPFYLLQFTDNNDVMRCGRYLWGTCTQRSDVVELAKAKLCHGRAQADNHSKLAALSCRFALHSNLIENVKSSLMANYMGTCTHISNDRMNLKVEYPSEPPLAEAAAHLMADEENFYDHLVALSRTLANTPISDPGECGEMVQRFVHTRIMDQCKPRDIYFSDSEVVVKEFLRKLLSSRVWDDFISSGCKPTRAKSMQTAAEVSSIMELLSGTISFTHWVRVTYPVTPKLLERAYNRRFAIVAQLDDFDHIVPIKMRDGTYSMIIEQVKNYTKGHANEYKASLLRKLHPASSLNCFDSSLSVVALLSLPKHDTKSVEVSALEGKVHIIAKGITPEIPEDTKNTLGRILKAETDIRKFSNDQQLPLLCNISPYQYAPANHVLVTMNHYEKEFFLQQDFVTYFTCKADRVTQQIQNDQRISAVIADFKSECCEFTQLIQSKRQLKVLFITYKPISKSEQTRLSKATTAVSGDELHFFKGEGYEVLQIADGNKAVLKKYIHISVALV